MEEGEPEYPSDTAAVVNYLVLAGMASGALAGLVLIFVFGILPLASTHPDAFAIYITMFALMLPVMAAGVGWAFYRWRNPICLILTIQSPGATSAKLSGNWKDPAAAIGRLFAEARSGSPSLILLENVSSLSRITRSSGDSPRRALSALLIGIEKTMPGQKVVVIMTSSDPLAIPVELLKENRLWRSVLVFRSGPEERGLLIRCLLRGKPVDSEVTPRWLEEIASSLDIDQIERLMKAATVRALMRAMKTRGPTAITRQDLEMTLQESRESPREHSKELLAAEIKAESALREALSKAGVARAGEKGGTGFSSIQDTLPGVTKDQGKGAVLAIGARAATVATLIAVLALDSDITVYRLLCSALAAKLEKM